MRRFACLAVAGLLLAACQSPATTALEGIDTEAADKSAAQKLADQITGEVTAPQDRALRVCMLIAGASELMADRVTHTDSGYAAEGLGQIEAMRGALASFDDAGGVFFETDLQRVMLQLTSVLVDVGKSRVQRLATTFAGGFNVPAMLERADVVARQAALTAALVRDTRALFVQIRAGGISTEAGRAACEGRIQQNGNRLRAMLGFAGL